MVIGALVCLVGGGSDTYHGSYRDGAIIVEGGSDIAAEDGRFAPPVGDSCLAMGTQVFFPWVMRGAPRSIVYGFRGKPSFFKRAKVYFVLLTLGSAGSTARRTLRCSATSAVSACKHAGRTIMMHQADLPLARAGLPCPSSLRGTGLSHVSRPFGACKGGSMDTVEQASGEAASGEVGKGSTRAEQGYQQESRDGEPCRNPGSQCYCSLCTEHASLVCSRLGSRAGDIASKVLP